MNDLNDLVRRKEFRVVAQLRRTQTNGDVFKPETNLTMNQEDSTNSNLQIFDYIFDQAGYQHLTPLSILVHDYSAALNNKHSQTPVMLMQNEGSFILIVMIAYTYFLWFISMKPKQYNCVF